MHHGHSVTRSFCLSVAGPYGSSDQHAVVRPIVIAWLSQRSRSRDREVWYLVPEEIQTVGNGIRDPDVTQDECNTLAFCELRRDGTLEHRRVPEEQFAFLPPYPLHHRVRCSNYSALG